MTKLPSLETANKNGWTHQVEWVEDGKPCFVRCKSIHKTNEWINNLTKEGLKPTVIDMLAVLKSVN